MTSLKGPHKISGLAIEFYLQEKKYEEKNQKIFRNNNIPHNFTLMPTKLNLVAK